MDRNKPTPRTQRDVSQQQVNPYLPNGKAYSVDKKSRAYQNSVKDSEVKNFTIGLRDIDESIMYYFKEVIRPSVIQNGAKLNVPIIYGSPERWKSVQADGYYRDKEGKIQVPLIMFKRSSIEKNRTLGNKLDGNEVNNYVLVETRYNKRNVYDRFSVLANRKPSKQLVATIIPDYVTIQYECVLFTDYVEQMNKLIEGINFASDSYWGDPERFKFRARIDTYTTVTELSTGQDRAVKTNFTITLQGYIISDQINKELANTDLVYSTSEIIIGTETTTDAEGLGSTTLTDSQGAAVTTFDTAQLNYNQIVAGMTFEEIKYVALQNTAIATSTTSTTATFNNVQIANDLLPAGFPAIGKADFKVYVNGQFIPSSQIVSIEQVDSNIVVTIDTVAVQYEILPDFEVVLIGKFEPITQE
jgi:hypothetical protein